MDSTLVPLEWFSHLAKRKNIGSDFHEITEKSMNWEIAFHDSFVMRLNLLQATSEDQEWLWKEYESVIEKEMTDLLIELKKNHEIWILSYTYQKSAEILMSDLWLGVEYVFANNLTWPYPSGYANDQKLLLWKESKWRIISDLKSKWKEVCFIWDGYQDALSWIEYADFFVWAGYYASREKVKKMSSNFVESKEQLSAYLLNL